MIEIAQRADSRCNDPVAASTLQIRDEVDATGVVLKEASVQAGGGHLPIVDGQGVVAANTVFQNCYILS